MDYHDDTSHLTKTALSVFCDSPREYYLQFVTKEMERKQATKQMAVGVVLHSVLLEQRELDDCLAVYPDECYQSDGKLNWRKSRPFAEANPGKHCCKQEEADSIYQVYEAIQNTAVYEAINECSKFEQVFEAKVYGTPCKCKPDIWGDMGEYIVMYDLKFMENVSPAAFQRSAKNFKYYLQDAHYSAVMRELFDKPTQFRFLAIETKFPFRVMPYWYIPQSREMARDYHKSKIIDFQACQYSGVWADKWASELTLHPWEIGGEVDDVLVEVGDEV